MSQPLAIKNLSVDITHGEHKAKGVDNVSIIVNKNEIVGVIGESGSGKTLTFSSALDLLNAGGSASIVSGNVYVAGEDIFRLAEKERREFLAKNTAIIFQNIHAMLNPVWSVGRQLTLYLKKTLPISEKKIRELLIESMDSMSIIDPEKCLHLLPSQLSGGMLQRVLCAFALAKKTDILIADEPTSNLDPIIANKVLDVIANKVKDRKVSMAVITHDIGLALPWVDRIIVMNSGEVVEEGKKEDIISRPKHPYTMQLLESMVIDGAKVY